MKRRRDSSHDYPFGLTTRTNRIESRQTQAWVRFPQDWWIVSAHVSQVPA
ncbi:MAG: AtzH-like domain-containing protein [Pseudonocardiaceae bacterium]